MVELGYVFAECRCREIAENREQHLESAEPEGAFHGVLYSYAGYGQAFANGYGECIHSYGNRNKQDLNDYRNHGCDRRFIAGLPCDGPRPAFLHAAYA